MFKKIISEIGFLFIFVGTKFITILNSHFQRNSWFSLANFAAGI